MYNCTSSQSTYVPVWAHLKNSPKFIDFELHYMGYHIHKVWYIHHIYTYIPFYINALLSLSTCLICLLTPVVGSVPFPTPVKIISVVFKYNPKDFGKHLKSLLGTGFSKNILNILDVWENLKTPKYLVWFTYPPGGACIVLYSSYVHSNMHVGYACGVIVFAPFLRVTHKWPKVNESRGKGVIRYVLMHKVMCAIPRSFVIMWLICKLNCLVIKIL